jgi:phosphocarrier protein
MMLAAAPGTRIMISVSGNEADEAMTALCELVSSGFGEED